MGGQCLVLFLHCYYFLSIVSKIRPPTTLERYQLSFKLFSHDIITSSEIEHAREECG